MASRLLPLLLLLLLTGASPSATPTPGNMSGFSTPSALPTPTPTGQCNVAVLDLTAAPDAVASISGTIAVPAAGRHTLQVTLVSPFASNVVQINGATPQGFGALAPGASTSKVIDVQGLWTFVVTTAGCAPNAVTIQGY